MYANAQYRELHKAQIAMVKPLTTKLWGKVPR